MRYTVNIPTSHECTEVLLRKDVPIIDCNILLTQRTKTNVAKFIEILLQNVYNNRTPKPCHSVHPSFLSCGEERVVGLLGRLRSFALLMAFYLAWAISRIQTLKSTFATWKGGFHVRYNFPQQAKKARGR